MPSPRALNNTTCKHDAWTLRVLHPEIVKYEYNDKKAGTVKAERFHCILVGEDCKVCCLGAVPWDPKVPSKAKTAFEKFKHGSIWTIKCPVLDKKAKPEYMGCPMKIAIILDMPSTLTMNIGSSNGKVAEHIAPPLKLARTEQQAYF